MNDRNQEKLPKIKNGFINENNSVKNPTNPNERYKNLKPEIFGSNNIEKFIKINSCNNRPISPEDKVDIIINGELINRTTIDDIPLNKSIQPKNISDFKPQKVPPPIISTKTKITNEELISSIKNQIKPKLTKELYNPLSQKLIVNEQDNSSIKYSNNRDNSSITSNQLNKSEISSKETEYWTSTTGVNEQNKSFRKDDVNWYEKYTNDESSTKRERNKYHHRRSRIDNNYPKESSKSRLFRRNSHRHSRHRHRHRRGGHIKNDIYHPNYAKMSDTDKAYWRVEFRRKFGLLRRAYPEFNIPDFDDDINLEIIHMSYVQYLQQAHTDKNASGYKLYLVIGWLALEFFAVKVLEWNFSGFTMNQWNSMNKYEDLLQQLGESSFSKITSKWRPEIRILIMILFNALIFIIIKYLVSWLGPGIGEVLQPILTGLMGGVSTARRNHQQESRGNNDIPDPPTSGGGLGGLNLGNIIANLGSMFTQNGNNNQGEPVRARRRPRHSE